MKERGPEELLDLHAPGMQLVREWVARSRHHVEVLPADIDRGCQCLHALRASGRSPLGAIALETGGLLVDHGWVRVLGSGHPRLPRALDSWNHFERDELRLPRALVVGDDALGGFYAIDYGALGDATGRVFYFAPDRLAWVEVASGYSDWLVRLLACDLDEFYRGQRWGDWRAELGAIPPTCAIAVYPPLWSKGPPIDMRSRASVPVEELWSLNVVDLPQQLADVRLR